MDINRLREWALEHNSQFYRQTVLLTSWLNADMNRLFSSSSYCCNYEGQVRFLCGVYEFIPLSHPLLVTPGAHKELM